MNKEDEVLLTPQESGIDTIKTIEVSNNIPEQQLSNTTDRIKTMSMEDDFGTPKAQTFNGVVKNYNMYMSPETANKMSDYLLGGRASIGEQTKVAINNVLTDLGGLGDQMAIAFGGLTNTISGGEIGEELQNIAYASMEARFEDMANKENAIGGVSSELANLAAGATSFLELATVGMATAGIGSLAQIGVQSMGQGTYNDMLAYANKNNGSLEGYNGNLFDLAVNVGNAAIQIAIEKRLGVGQTTFLNRARDYVGAVGGAAAKGFIKEFGAGAVQEATQSIMTDIAEIIKGNEEAAILMDNADQYLRDALVGGILQGTMGAATYATARTRADGKTSLALAKANGRNVPTKEDIQKAQRINDTLESGYASAMTEEMKDLFEASTAEGKTYNRILGELDKATKNSGMELDESERAQLLPRIAAQQTLNALGDSLDKNISLADHKINLIKAENGDIWIEGTTPEVGEKSVPYSRILLNRQKAKSPALPLYKKSDLELKKEEIKKATPENLREFVSKTTNEKVVDLSDKQIKEIALNNAENLELPNYSSENEDGILFQTGTENTLTNEFWTLTPRQQQRKIKYLIPDNWHKSEFLDFKPYEEGGFLNRNGGWGLKKNGFILYKSKNFFTGIGSIKSSNYGIIIDNENKRILLLRTADHWNFETGKRFDEDGEALPLNQHIWGKNMPDTKRKQTGYLDITDWFNIQDKENIGTFSKEDSNIYNQTKATGKGTRAAYDEQLKKIILGKDSDLTSIQHEFAHYWIQNNFKWARSGLATDDWKKKWGAVEDWLGIKSDDKKLSREASEKFAKAYERFVMEGKQEPVLNWAFDKFSELYRDIYDDLEGEYFDLNEELNPDIVDWFNRIGELTPAQQVSKNLTAVSEAILENGGNLLEESEGIITESKLENGEISTTAYVSKNQESKSNFVETDGTSKSQLGKTAKKQLGMNIQGVELNKVDLNGTIENASEFIKADRQAALIMLNDETTTDIDKAALYNAFMKEVKETNNADLFSNLITGETAKTAREVSTALRLFDTNIGSDYNIKEIAENILKSKGELKESDLNTELADMNLENVELTEQDGLELENETECKL